MDEPIHQLRPKHSNTIQIGLLTVGITMVGSNSLVLSPILTDVAADFAATPGQTARAMAAYGGATALSAFTLARHIDRVGPRQMLSIGMIVMVLSIAASALTDSWWALALAQAAAGMGAGIVLPATYHMASTVARKGAEARAIGRVLMGWSLSLVFGVPAAAILTDLFGWRSVFLVLAGLGLVTIIGFVKLLPRQAPITEAAREGPLAPLRVATVPVLLGVCFTFMLGFYGVYPFVGDHLRVSHDISASLAGLFVLAYGAGFGLASFGDGLIDRFEARRIFPIVLLVASFIYAVLIVASDAMWSILAMSAVWGFVNHFGLNMLVLLLSRADANRRGAILGLNSAVTYLAAFVGAALFGEIYTEINFAAVCWLASLSLACAALLAFVGLRTQRAVPREA